jgi:hypothetical protein
MFSVTSDTASGASRTANADVAEVLTLLLRCQYKSANTDAKGAGKVAGKDTAVMDQILQDCLNLLLQGVYIPV